MTESLGAQILIELKDCNVDKLNDLDFIRETMLEAAHVAGATIITSSFRYFEPHGISGVVVIAESHLTIHTWPEFGYAAIDIFTCGQKVRPWEAFEFLKNVLEAKSFSTQEIRRGVLDQS